MKKILHVISSPRGEASFSIKLGNAIVEKIQAKYPDSTVRVSDLVKNQFPHLEESHINSFYTPADARTPEHITAVKHSDEAVKEIMDADIIVIGAPMYSFNIHSTLKAWIDHIARAGVTFKYGANGPEGLVKGKKVYVAISSGGIYSEGERKAIDYIEPYMLTVLGFMGMTDVSVYRVEGVSMPAVQETALAKAVDSIQID